MLKGILIVFCTENTKRILLKEIRDGILQGILNVFCTENYL